METKSRALYNEPPVPMWRTVAGWLVFGVVCVALFLFGGCTSAPVKKVEESAARAVKTYCATLPYEVRAGIIKPSFDAAIAPDKATVDCYGDPNNPRPDAATGQ